MTMKIKKKISIILMIFEMLLGVIAFGQENNNKKISLRTKVGILQAELNDKNLVSINMGQPNFEWNKIPLLKKMDNQNLEIKIECSLPYLQISRFDLVIWYETLALE